MMMEIGRCATVLDPYDWLPGYGESGVELCTQGADLSVIISYDGESGELKKELLFRHAVAFFKAACPGPSMLDMKCSVSCAASMSSLIEYPDSEAAKAWRDHFQGLFDIKHYSIFFMSENVILVVFAEDVVLRDVAA